MLIFRKKTKVSEQGTSKENATDAELTKQLQDQSNLEWKIIDALKKNDLKKSDLMHLLCSNDQMIFGGIDMVSDKLLTFVILLFLIACKKILLPSFFVCKIKLVTFCLAIYMFLNQHIVVKLFSAL